MATQLMSPQDIRAWLEERPDRVVTVMTRVTPEFSVPLTITREQAFRLVEFERVKRHGGMQAQIVDNRQLIIGV